MNKIAGYRKMLGKSQKQIAANFNISEQAYRNKEKGRTEFKKGEMQIFKTLLVNQGFTNITIDDIFFDHQPTQTDFLEKEVN